MKRGFTLVEMLAASAMAALLLVTVLVVISSLGRERRAMAERSKVQTPPDLTEIIRWDLVNARSIGTVRGVVTLSGFGTLDPDSLAPTPHRPVEVVYEVRRAAGKSWLVRRQRAPDNFDLSSTELVCSGVAGLSIIRQERSDGPTQDATTQPSTRPSKYLALSDCVRLRVKWDDPNRAPIDRMLVLR